MKGPVLAAVAATMLLAPISADAATTKVKKHHHHVVMHERSVRGADAMVVEPSMVEAPVVHRRSFDPCENVTVSNYGNCSKLSGAGS